MKPIVKQLISHIIDFIVHNDLELDWRACDINRSDYNHY